MRPAILANTGGPTPEETQPRSRNSCALTPAATAMAISTKASDQPYTTESLVAQAAASAPALPIAATRSSQSVVVRRPAATRTRLKAANTASASPDNAPGAINGSIAIHL